MNKFKDCTQETVLYIVIILLFGVLNYKLFGNWHLDEVFTQVMAAVHLTAIVVLSWIAGWSNGNKK